MEKIPENCPGVDSEDAGKREACAGCPNQSICASAPKGPDPDLTEIVKRMENVEHTILVLSGKGGVGKSTIASQLAFVFAQDPDCDVGLLDIDICGPSIPKMLGLEGEDVHQSASGWSPVYVSDNLGVMSIGFMLPNPDDAVVWRGPRKNALIKQFLKDVDWGHLDFLVIDAPPGTSDEHISIAQFLKSTKVDGALIVTSPQDVAIADVRKEINFCKKVGLRVIGVVENMSDLQCPISDIAFLEDDVDVTQKVIEALRAARLNPDRLFGRIEILDATKGGGMALAKQMNVPFLGSIPMDPKLSQAAEQGKSILDPETKKKSPGAKAFENIVKSVLDLLRCDKSIA